MDVFTKYISTILNIIHLFRVVKDLPGNIDRKKPDIQG